MVSSQLVLWAGGLQSAGTVLLSLIMTERWLLSLSSDMHGWCSCPLPVLQTQLEAQRSTQDFQRATEVLRAAKETIALAEQRLLEDDKRQFDSAWQEMLNHATQRVSDAKVWDDR